MNENSPINYLFNYLNGVENCSFSIAAEFKAAKPNKYKFVNLCDEIKEKLDIDISCESVHRFWETKTIVQQPTPHYLAAFFLYTKEIINKNDLQTKEVKGKIKLTRQYWSDYINWYNNEINSDVRIMNKRLFDDFEFIDENYWEVLKIANQEIRAETLAGYFTHIHSSLIPNAVAKNDFIENPSEDHLYDVKINGKVQTKLLSDILNSAKSEAIALIKIFGEGGVGKSTFLYWLAKTYYSYYNVFMIKRLVSQTGEELVNVLSSIANTLPILLIIDDIATMESELLNFIGIVTNFSENHQQQIVLIISEREYRYNFLDKKILRKFENTFEGNTYQINFCNIYKKEKVFERLFPLLVDEKQISYVKKRTAEERYLDKKIESISESTYNLILHLKEADDIEINYAFDWDDWNDFIEKNQKFEQLAYLFVAVACFYQFGIGLPANYAAHYFQTNVLKITDAVATLGEKSPLLLKSRIVKNDIIILKNEYVALWFMKEEKNVALATSFFNTFFSQIDNAEASWLFRKINKLIRDGEFFNSKIGDLLNLEKSSCILKESLKVTSLSLKDILKNKMELGINLIKESSTKDSAISVFEEIVTEDEFNIYARHQLAEIYAESRDTYQLSYNEYIEILKIDNNNTYAYVGKYQLLQRAKNEQIEIALDEKDKYIEIGYIVAKANELSLHSLHQFIQTLILQKEFDNAEKLLQQISKPTKATAECHYQLARALPTETQFIERKKTHFKIAKKNDGNSFRYSINYAIFLYRIFDFARSSKLIRNLCKSNPVEKEGILVSYNSKISSTRMLYIEELQSKHSYVELKQILSKYFKQARSMCGTNRPHQIRQGYHLLEVVRYYSYRKILYIYFNCTNYLAGCYFYNSEINGWNNLSPAENKLMAENIISEMQSVPQWSKSKHLFQNNNKLSRLLKGKHS